MAIQYQLNFTRENEYEPTDRLQRLDAAGFDDTAMATSGAAAARHASPTAGSSYLRTHPVTYDRIAEAQARAYGRPYRQVVDTLDFHMVRALLRSYEGEPKDAVLFFDNALAERKYNNEIAVHYGLVAALLRARNYDRATTELVVLEKMAPPHPMIDAMAGHVALDSGDVKTAIRRLRAASRNTQQDAAGVRLFRGAAAGRPQRRRRALRAPARAVPQRRSIASHRVCAYAALGNTLMHKHQGEHYAWQGI